MDKSPNELDPVANALGPLEGYFERLDRSLSSLPPDEALELLAHSRGQYEEAVAAWLAGRGLDSTVTPSN